MNRGAQSNPLGELIWNKKYILDINYVLQISCISATCAFKSTVSCQISKPEKKIPLDLVYSGNVVILDKSFLPMLLRLHVLSQHNNNRNPLTILHFFIQHNTNAVTFQGDFRFMRLEWFQSLLLSVRYTLTDLGCFFLSR